MNSDDTIAIGPHTKQLMEKIAAEGNESAEYTKEEKLALVADGLMAPEEVGLVSAEEAHLQLMPEAEREVVFGNELFLQMGVIPLELRAEWAYDENKIILAPADKTAWIEEWIGENKKTYRIQGGLRCGSLQGKFERTFRDPVIGLAQMLRVAADMLEAKYAGEPSPPATDQPEPTPLQLKDRTRNEPTKPTE